MFDLDLIEVLDGFIKSSQSKLAPRNPDDFIGWQQCVALSKLGWKAICQKDQADLIVTWQKEGKPDLHIKLSFIEQCIWLDYLEKKEKNDNKSDKSDK